MLSLQSLRKTAYTRTHVHVPQHFHAGEFEQHSLMRMQEEQEAKQVLEGDLAELKQKGSQQLKEQTDALLQDTPTSAGSDSP